MFKVGKDWLWLKSVKHFKVGEDWLWLKSVKMGYEYFKFGKYYFLKYFLFKNLLNFYF